MWTFLKRILGHTSPAGDRGDAFPKASVWRDGKRVEVGPVFRAWTSQDLDAMLKVLTAPSNPIDRHFLLQGIVNATYKRRSEAAMAVKCAEVAELHLSEFPEIAPALERDLGILPRVVTFQLYATLLTERGDFDRAVAVCERAIEYGLQDGTKSGFRGRIERIRKMRRGGSGEEGGRVVEDVSGGDDSGDTRHR